MRWSSCWRIWAAHLAKVLYIKVPDEILLARLSGRLDLPGVRDDVPPALQPAAADRCL